MDHVNLTCARMLKCLSISCVAQNHRVSSYDPMMLFIPSTPHSLLIEVRCPDEVICVSCLQAFGGIRLRIADDCSFLAIEKCPQLSKASNPSYDPISYASEEHHRLAASREVISDL